jgi:hypothetical protein
VDWQTVFTLTLRAGIDSQRRSERQALPIAHCRATSEQQANDLQPLGLTGTIVLQLHLS